MLNTAEQQNKSANKNKYKILNPLEETIKVIKHNNMVTALENLIVFNLELIISFTSTIIKLEIALIIVSILLIVNEIARNI